MADFPKHPGPRFSLATRRATVANMANIVSTVTREKVARGLMRQAEASLVEDQMGDVFGTFVWLVDHEADIRALVKLPAADRAVLLAHLDVAIAAAKAAQQTRETTNG
jgi:predicted transcriptional regulator